MFPCEEVEGLLRPDQQSNTSCEEYIAEGKEGGIEEQDDADKDEECAERDQSCANLCFRVFEMRKEWIVSISIELRLGGSGDDAAAYFADL